MNQLHILTPYLFRVRFNIIFPSPPRSLQTVSSLQPSDFNFVYICNPRACCIPLPIADLYALVMFGEDNKL
jgi:hypothetical protein